MQKKQKSKLTPEQKKKHKEILKKFNSQLEASEGNEAIDLQTAKQAPKMVWACTPEIKLKASMAQYDLELSPEQARGGVIRIVRTGSNRIKICSMVETKYLDDGVGEAKAEKKAKDQAELEKAVAEVKKKKVSK